MQGSMIAAALAAALMTGGVAPASAEPGLRQDVSVQVYLYAGRQYCWYDHAWRGPGWYECGYAWRRNLGWGGFYGWHGWGGGHFPGGYPGGHHHHHGPGRPGGHPGKPGGGHQGPGQPGSGGPTKGAGR